MDPSLVARLPVTDHIKPLPLTAEVTGHVVGNAVVMFAAIVVVAGRFLCRTVLGAGLGKDDWLVLASLILSTASSGIYIAMCVAGAGHNTIEVAMLGNLPHILLMTFVIFPTTVLSLALTKFSILFFYMRVFKDRMRLYCWVTMGLVFAWSWAVFLSNLFICTPIRAQFDLTVAKPDSCGNQVPILQASIIVNILTDIVIMIPPMKTIWSLNMRRPEKLGLMMSFMMLIGVVVVGIVRIHYASAVDVRKDLTATMPISAFAMCIELNLAIICVSIPMLRPLYMRYRTKCSASKLSEEEAQHSAGAGGSSSYGKERYSKRSRSRAAGPAVDITLNTLFAGDQHKDDYGVGGVSNTIVEVGSAHSVGSGQESERVLTGNAGVSPGHLGHDGGHSVGAIGVHKMWEIRRE
ncbi:integral membrane protein [Magnaporthiopsis poae ATCC 64411]|uniref:Integral membrane protein n=1 Tax=Magnaporthiopsis poae (strain ATCC 64411 / 73-15) TaxID=644358 RepID=A0A0C4E3L2_MAGP6|nr:integral membrane protein [Magnaporthiopsis poae ATCC 64411]